MAADLAAGVALGYALMAVFVGLLARFYIFTRASWSQMTEASTFAIRPPPESYLRFATHSFVSMIATGAIITLVFGGADWNDTPFVREYGMNTLSFFFELPPSTYVMPSYWLITAFSALRYCVLDTERLLREQTSAWCKYCGIATNGTFALVAMLFSTAWSVSIEDDIVAHELPFLMLVMCIPLVYIMHVWEMSFSRRTTCLAIVTLSVYAHVSVFYALSIVALRYRNMNPEYVKPLQWLWVGLSALCPPTTYPAARSSLKPIGGNDVQVPHDLGKLPEASPVEPIKIQVQPKRPETPEEPSYTTAASQSSARTPESVEQALAANVAEEQPGAARRAAGAPLRFAMGLSSAEAERCCTASSSQTPPGRQHIRDFVSNIWRQNSLATAEAQTTKSDWLQEQRASVIMAEARTLAGSRPLMEVPPTSPCIGQVPPTSPCIGQVPPTSPCIGQVPPTSPCIGQVPPTSPITGQASPASPSKDEAASTNPFTPQAASTNPFTPQAQSTSPITAQAGCADAAPAPMQSTLRSQGLLGLHTTLRSQRSLARPGSTDGGVEVQLIGTGLLEAQERSPPEAAYAITQEVIKTAVSSDALQPRDEQPGTAKEEAGQEGSAEVRDSGEEEDHTEEV